MIRTKGEAGTGNVVEAVRHQRAVMSQIRKASVMTDEELYAFAKEIQAPYHLLKETARLKKLPVVNFAAGGLATPCMFIRLFKFQFCVLIALCSGCGVNDAAWMRWRCVVTSLVFYLEVTSFLQFSSVLVSFMCAICFHHSIHYLPIHSPVIRLSVLELSSRL
jgi:pyridoxal 5'-phosphate synthase pdxS subunit